MELSENLNIFVLALFTFFFCHGIRCQQIFAFDPDLSPNNNSLLSNEPHYFVVASKVIRPCTEFGISVHAVRALTDSLEDKYDDFKFYASINLADTSVITLEQPIPWNIPQMVYMQIPQTLTNGNYSVHLKGTDLSNKRLLFNRNTTLQVINNFLVVSIQTSRPIYRAGQTVLFRIIALQTTLIPFDDILDVFIIDPDGHIIKRWLSTYTNNGVCSLSFKLPKLARDGIWKIRTKFHSQFDEKNIIVETYYQPFFEVIVSLPSYVTEDEGVIRGAVTGILPSQKLIRGNATIRWSERKFKNEEKFTSLKTEYYFIKEEKYPISLDMQLIRTILGEHIADVEIKVDVALTDFVSGITCYGYSHVRIITSKLTLRFLSRSPAFFTPGAPLHGHVVLSYEDDERVPEEILKTSLITVKIESNDEQLSTVDDIIINGKESSAITGDFFTALLENERRDIFLDQNLLTYIFDIPSNTSTKEFHLSASCVITNEGSNITVESRLKVLKSHFASGSRKYFKVWTSSNNLLQVKDYAIFHAILNFKTDWFNYIIVSKGSVLRTQAVNVIDDFSSPTTFSVPISADMAPWFHLIVYCISFNGEILSDSVTVPVDGFSQFETTLMLNMGKDLKGESIEAIVSGAEGAFIGIQAVRSSIFQLQGGNEISHSSITDSFQIFENNKRSIRKVSWISRDGLTAPEIRYLVSFDYTFDSYTTFAEHNLITMTDLEFLRHNRDLCAKNENTKLHMIPCLSSGCFPQSKKCDKVDDCEDGYDEWNCDISTTDDYVYRMSRSSRNSFIYDMLEGDWGYREIKKNDHQGIEFEVMITPSTSDNWYFTAFSIDMKYGLSILNSPVVFSSERPLMAHISGPTECRRGEQLGLRLFIHNMDSNRMLVTITLIGSEDYKFVHVEAGGIVSSYAARLSSGDHQILIYMPSKSQQQLEFPIAVVTESNETEVLFKIFSQTSSLFLSHKIRIQGEGALINRHTSVFLDLKNRALVLQYLDVAVEESPIVPYQVWRRYVYGSTSASLTISGDLIGPAFTKIPLTMNSLLERESKGSDSIAFELATNVWTLHYLRLTSQLNFEITKQVLEECNTLYAELKRYFKPDGSFVNWEPLAETQSSVWLTSWILRTFKQANFNEWEFHLWIDHEIFIKGLKWILNFQEEAGNFVESTKYGYALDYKMNPNFTKAEEYIALTSHVLITLQELLEVTDGQLKTNLSTAILKARLYLEQHLSSTLDAYYLPIMTYALMISNSVEKGFAFILLQANMKRNLDGYPYWSREEIPVNPVKLENQRAFIKPRLYHEGDSLAVEATSWALLCHLIWEGVTPVTEKITQWLISTRMTNNGFISTMDTVVAFHALTEFAYRSRLLAITDIKVTAELMASHSVKKQFRVVNSSLSSAKIFHLPDVWGHINLIATGTGLAVAQLDVNYGIDYEPLKEKPTYDIFDLHISEFYSAFRNKSSIIIQSCFRYVRKKPPVSGAAVLEVQLPTGYFLVESEAINLIKSGVHPTLRDAHTTEGKTQWFFDFIPQQLTCFNHTVTRWFPVANMTLYRKALLYEITAREHFVQTLINSTSLNVLSICEVCGSFQCPYCPYYNASDRLFQMYYLHFTIFLYLIYTVIISE